MKDVSLTEKELMTADARTVAALPDCVIEDLAQYHDVECACVYCSELRWRERRAAKRESKEARRRDKRTANTLQLTD